MKNGPTTTTAPALALVSKTEFNEITSSKLSINAILEELPAGNTMAHDINREEIVMAPIEKGEQTIDLARRATEENRRARAQVIANPSHCIAHIALNILRSAQTIQTFDGIDPDALHVKAFCECMAVHNPALAQNVTSENRKHPAGR